MSATAPYHALPTFLLQISQPLSRCCFELEPLPTRRLVSYILVYEVGSRQFGEPSCESRWLGEMREREVHYVAT
jgi:hypothetical protein